MWRQKLLVGDKLISKTEHGFLIYSDVQGMTRRKTTRFVKGFSCACTNGEVGDIYVSGVDCLVEPKVWDLLRLKGWPETVDGIATVCEMHDRDGQLMPMLKLAPHGCRTCGRDLRSNSQHYRYCGGGCAAF